MYIVYGINYTKLTMRFTYRTYLHKKRYIHATLEYKFMNALRYINLHIYRTTKQWTILSCVKTLKHETTH